MDNDNVGRFLRTRCKQNSSTHQKPSFCAGCFRNCRHYCG